MAASIRFSSVLWNFGLLNFRTETMRRLLRNYSSFSNEIRNGVKKKRDFCKLRDRCNEKQMRRLNSKAVILGIETSCDDTGAAVMDSDGKVLGECIHSQQEIHLANGGIIPPLARDLHKENIHKVVTKALKQSGLKLTDLDAIATTVKPGLELCLWVGLNYSKELVQISGKPFIPIHHMEAHALTIRMGEKVDFPFLVLLISGGHCQIAVVNSVNDFVLLGRTIDDAPGEALDKTARRLKLRNKLEYRNMSGGKAIEKLALLGDPLKYDLTIPLYKYRDCNFSFAGLKFLAMKTIMREEKLHNIEADGIIPNAADVCASFQHAIARHLVKRVHRAIIYSEMENLIPDENKVLVVSGGVACNQYIRGALQILCNQTGYRMTCPPPNLCNDNGSMIAWNGIERYNIENGGVTNDVESIKVQPKCSLGKDISSDVLSKSIKMAGMKLDPEKIRNMTINNSIKNVIEV